MYLNSVVDNLLAWPYVSNVDEEARATTLTSWTPLNLLLLMQVLEHFCCGSYYVSITIV
jgi:hypothetical protein